MTYGNGATPSRASNQGHMSVYTIDEVKNNNYKLLDIKEVIDLPQIKVDEELEKRIMNGQVLDKFFDDDKVMIINSKDEVIAIYQKKDDFLVKPYRMFI